MTNAHNISENAQFKTIQGMIQVWEQGANRNTCCIHLALWKKSWLVLSTATLSVFVVFVCFCNCLLWVSVDSEMARIKDFQINISNDKTLDLTSSHPPKNHHQAIKGREKIKEKKTKTIQESFLCNNEVQGRRFSRPLCGLPEDTAEAPRDTCIKQVPLCPACFPTVLRVLHGLIPAGLSPSCSTWPLISSCPGFQPSTSWLKLSSN